MKSDQLERKQVGLEKVLSEELVRERAIISFRFQVS